MLKVMERFFVPVRRVSKCSKGTVQRTHLEKETLSGA